MGVVQERSLDRRFFATLGATRLHRDFCGYVAADGISTTLGPGVHMLPEDIKHSRFIVLWGTNTLHTNVHLWRWIETARRSGAVVVAIDPRRSATAARADWHVRPLPGTDAVLALGLMHVLIREHLVDHDYLDSHAEGFGTLQSKVEPYTPAAVTEVTGVAVSELSSLAREFAARQPSVIRLLLGLEKHSNGAATARAIACLPTLVGAWRQRGGGLLHLTSALHAEALNLDAVTMPHLESSDTRDVHWAQLGRALTGLQRPRVRVLVAYNSNPATTAPNTAEVVRGLQREDLFTVVHEQTMTDTARYADYVLPATTMIEHWDLLRSYGHTYVTLNRPATEPRGAAVSNTELFRRLASALRMPQRYLQTRDVDLIKAALDSTSPLLQDVTFDRLMDEGWAELALPTPWLVHRDGFATSSGKCDVSLAELDSDAPAIADGYLLPLALIATKTSERFFNSTYAGADGDRSGKGTTPTLSIAVVDADSRGIVNGDLVEVFNERGTVRLIAGITDSVPSGVVSAPHGWWRSRAPHGYTANLLTGDGLSDRGGGSNLYDARVDVRRIDEPHA